MQRFAGGIDLSENGEAMDAIEEVGPGSDYLGCSHTQRNFEDAFWRSSNADNNSFEQWLAEGSMDAAARAHATWNKQLADYVAPDLDQSIDEQLLAFMQQRKAVLPDTVS